MSFTVQRSGTNREHIVGKCTGAHLFGFLLVVIAGESSVFGQFSEPARLQLALADAIDKQDWEAATKQAMLLTRLQRQDKQAREQLRFALRRWTQQRRMQDLTSIEGLCDLTPPQLLRLYGEGLSRLNSFHVDRSQVQIGRLFLQGLEEFDLALSDSMFRQRFFPGVSPQQLERLKTRLKTSLKERQVDSIPLAQATLQEVIRITRRETSCDYPAAIVLEFLCGACHSLDEYTQYLSASEIVAELQETEESPSIIDVQLLKDQIGYMRIQLFRETTVQEFEQALQQLRMNNMMAPLRGVVLDVRSNPGGSLTAATQLAEKLVPHGMLASTIGPVTEMTRTFPSTSGMNALDLPVSVLMDGQTASAAEVFALALQHHRRAKLVGTATFGKGTLQAFVRFSGDDMEDVMRQRSRGGLRITLAKLLSPNGQAINTTGIQPDIEETHPDRQLAVAIDALRD